MTDEQLAAATLAKTQAEARAAAAAADKAEREEIEASSPAAVRRRVAIAGKEEVEAGQATVAAAQKGIGALIPDLSKVERGTLTFDDRQPIFGHQLAQAALSAAAADVAARVAVVAGRGGGRATVLVTTDDQLAQADAVYHDVTGAAEQLEHAATDLLDRTKAVEGEHDRHNLVEPASLMTAATLGALTGAIPPLLSLLRTNRTVSAATLTIDQLSAVAAVSGALLARGIAVHHSDFRFAPEAGLEVVEKTLPELRAQLVGRQLELEEQAAAALVARTTARRAA